MKKHNRLFVIALAGTLFGGCTGTGGTRATSQAETGAIVSEGGEDKTTGISKGSKEKDKPILKKVGKYRRATDYEAIRAAVKKAEEELWFIDEVYVEEMAATEAKTEAATDAQSAESAAPTADGSPAHSETNVQTEGVDEADVVKTDGRYIYTLERTGEGDRVAITSIRDGEFDFLGYVDTSEISGDLSIREFYVDGDTLQIIGDAFSTELSDRDGYYQTDTQNRVYVLTYDMKDRRKAELAGSVYVSGSYRTSRRADGIVYLFTDETLSDPGEDAEAADWLPDVNGTAMEADCCFLPVDGSRNLLMITSISTDEPSEVIDNKAILYRGAEPYISLKSILLRQEEYRAGRTSTELVKFSYEAGRIAPVAATNVRGAILDTFAINESGDYLRVLTTDWDGTSDKNNLFVLDESMKTVGSIRNIAPGERIYSARFLGDTAYFVTYRNTDPLFAVDLSDPRNPKILGELKVTGFSEYLHSWDGEHLFGIGYETDPDTGWNEGLKISMFDVSDPAELAEQNRSVLRDYQESPAMYAYKTVLVDQKANLIGFAAYSWEKDMAQYLVYRYSDEKGFEKVFEERLDDCWGQGLQRVRGLYVGDTFILSEEGQLRSYDLTDMTPLDTYHWGR